MLAVIDIPSVIPLNKTDFFLTNQVSIASSFLSGEGILCPLVLFSVGNFSD